jgi:hypothetical protein
MQLCHGTAEPRLDRQSFAAFAAAVLEHSASTGRAHTSAESVDAQAASFLGLPCTLRHMVSYNELVARATQVMTNAQVGYYTRFDENPQVNLFF